MSNKPRRKSRPSGPIAPHAPTDLAKVASLVSAYLAGAPVPAVVVIEFAADAYAISGSHRLAAIREAGVDVDLVVADGESMFAAAEAAGDSDACDALARLADGRGGDFDALFDALRVYLPTDAVEAFEAAR